MFCLILGVVIGVGAMTLYFSSCSRMSDLEANNDIALIDEDVSTQYQPEYIKRLEFSAIEANLEEKEIIYIVKYIMVYNNENRIMHFLASVKPCDPEFDINGDGWDVDTEIILYGED